MCDVALQRHFHRCSKVIDCQRHRERMDNITELVSNSNDFLQMKVDKEETQA